MTLSISLFVHKFVKNNVDFDHRTQLVWYEENGTCLWVKALIQGKNVEIELLFPEQLIPLSENKNFVNLISQSYTHFTQELSFLIEA